MRFKLCGTRLRANTQGSFHGKPFLMLASQSLPAFSPSAEHINNPNAVISIKNALQNNLEGTLSFIPRFELRHYSIYTPY